MTSRLLSTLLIPAVALAGLSLGLGCDNSDSGGGAGGGAKGDITVALLPKKKGVPYFTSVADGAQKAAYELGVTLIYDGPTDGSPESAAAMVEKWTLQGVDVIAVSPNDPAVLSPAMKSAQEQGVKVITWDADADADARSYFVNQATAQQIGYELVDALAADIAAAEGLSDPKQVQGQVGIITATLTAANQNEWMEHMRQRLEEYPGLELVGVKPSDEDQKQAFQMAQDMIKAYPEIKGFFAISSVAFPGVAEAVKQAGKSGEIQVTGLSTPNDMRSYVEDGTVKTVILWDTRALGRLTMHVAHQLATGRLETGATSISAGDLGDKQIEGDHVLLGGLMRFTKENIGEYDF